VERIDVAGLTIAFERTGQGTQAGDRAFNCVTREYGHGLGRKRDWSPRSPTVYS
jgi:hypothetical protein